MKENHLQGEKKCVAKMRIYLEKGFLAAVQWHHRQIAMLFIKRRIHRTFSSKLPSLSDQQKKMRQIFDFNG